MSNKEKFLKLVSKEKTSSLHEIKARIKNRAMLHESQQIALKVLVKLDELAWSQKDLALKMGVSPQQINKIVKGGENLTLETQKKLQDILDIPILASYYENQANKLKELSLTIEKKVQVYVIANQEVSNYKLTNTVKLNRTAFSTNYSKRENLS